MRYIVGSAIAEKQEAVSSEGWCIVPCLSPELQKVEDGEDSEEGWKSPPWTFSIYKKSGECGTSSEDDSE